MLAGSVTGASATVTVLLPLNLPLFLLPSLSTLTLWHWNGLVICGCSGHGFPTGWAVELNAELPIDIVLNTWRQAAVQSARLVLLLDCCYAIHWDTLKAQDIQVERC